MPGRGTPDEDHTLRGMGESTPPEPSASFADIASSTPSHPDLGADGAGNGTPRGGAPPRQQPGARGTPAGAGTAAQHGSGPISDIVQQAAGILNEEIAARILAAQQAGQRFVGRGAMRSADAEQLALRFRQEAHQMVDIVLDLLTLAAKSIGQLPQLREPSRHVDHGSGIQRPDGAGVPVLVAPRPVRAGDVVEIPVTSAGDDRGGPGGASFSSTDLVGSFGQRIPAAYVRFVPTRQNAAAQESASATISVTVPHDVPPGVYSGLIQADLPALRAVLVVQVV